LIIFGTVLGYIPILLASKRMTNVQPHLSYVAILPEKHEPQK